MAYTGGPLNVLNETLGITKSYKSVSVMELIKVHKPKSKDELVDLIKYHYENDCECGIKSKGTIEDFGKNLYDAQQPFWKEYKFSLKECTQWVYNLVIVKSLKGSKMERKATQELSKLLPDYQVSETNLILDKDFRVDLVVSKGKVEICGIQVKPTSFKGVPKEIKEYNKKANKKWGKPVFYLYYDRNDIFININDKVEKILNLT